MSPRARRSALRWIALALALAVLVTASLAFWLWQSGDVREAQDSAAEDRAALNAATLETMAWASVDYRKIDEFVTKVKSGATGSFLKQFDDSEDALRQLISQNESVQVPTIPSGGAALLERRGSEARVLIVMDANVSNKSTKSPQPRQYRLQVSLSKVDGRWLTSELEFVDEQA